MDRIISLIKIDSIRKTISLTIYLTLLCGLFFSGFLHIFILNNLQHTEEEVQTFIDMGDAVSDDVTDILNTLNAENADVCDDMLLDRMRMAQFRSDYAKDIGFMMNDELICTTGLGVLEKPYRGSPPQFKTLKGYDMWMNVPIMLFGFQRNAAIVRHGNFNVVLNVDSFLNVGSKEHDVAVFVNKGDRELIARQETHQLMPAAKEDYSRFTLRGFETFRCSDKSVICAIAHTPMLRALSSNGPQIIGIFVLSFLSATFITLYINGYMNRLLMFRNRFLRNMTEEDIVCFYQPVVDTITGRPIGCEVLVRWKDEEGNIVTPDKFLDIVKQEHKTEEFTNIIIQNAFRDLQELIEQNPCMKISFNVFPVGFKYSILSSQLSRYKEMYPQLKINLELTEDELVEAPKIATEITRLRKDGYLVSIDDFGTGYSSLSYLQEIKVDFIKIDRSFVRDLERDTIKSKLIPLIVNIAKTIDSDIIIEGVETRAQVDYICELGIEFIQGYYFSKPLPADQFIDFINNSRQ